MQMKIKRTVYVIKYWVCFMIWDIGQLGLKYLVFGLNVVEKIYKFSVEMAMNGCMFTMTAVISQTRWLKKQ